MAKAEAKSPLDTFLGIKWKNKDIQQINVLAIDLYCKKYSVDYEELMKLIEQSEVSFGTNPDTLLSSQRFEEFLKAMGHTLEPGYEEVWFSLGC